MQTGHENLIRHSHDRQLRIGGNSIRFLSIENWITVIWLLALIPLAAFLFFPLFIRAFLASFLSSDRFLSFCHDVNNIMYIFVLVLFLFSSVLLSSLSKKHTVYSVYALFYIRAHKCHIRLFIHSLARSVGRSVCVLSITRLVRLRFHYTLFYCTFSLFLLVLSHFFTPCAPHIGKSLTRLINNSAVLRFSYPISRIMCF